MKKPKKHQKKISNTSQSSLDKFICNKSTHEEKIAEILIEFSLSKHATHLFDQSIILVK